MCEICRLLTIIKETFQVSILITTHNTHQSKRHISFQLNF